MFDREIRCGGNVDWLVNWLPRRCHETIDGGNCVNSLHFFFFLYRLCSIKDAAGANPQPNGSLAARRFACSPER